MKYRPNELWSLCKSIYDLGMFINFSYIINKNRNLGKLKNDKSFFPRKLINFICLCCICTSLFMMLTHYILIYIVFIFSFYPSQDLNNFLLQLLFLLRNQIFALIYCKNITSIIYENNFVIVHPLRLNVLHNSGCSILLS